jgi:hypothetical protein
MQLVMTGLLFSGLNMISMAQSTSELSAREAAPVDFTGYWVSVISEDWRWRMVTPAKGDFANVPLNDEGRKMGHTWDPDTDETAGEQCRAYGAPAVMRNPGRVHISWEDENTLRIHADEGNQVRLLHFNKAPPENIKPSWQGYSHAQWEKPSRALTQARERVSVNVGIGGADLDSRRSLEVETTRLRPGYYRKNGVPYSANAVMKEYFDISTEPNGDIWFVVTTIVDDPEYLEVPFVNSTNFKKQKGKKGWAPNECTTR